MSEAHKVEVDLKLTAGPGTFVKVDGHEIRGTSITITAAVNQVTLVTLTFPAEVVGDIEGFVETTAIGDAWEALDQAKGGK